jgi:hypothetical protein
MMTNGIRRRDTFAMVRVSIESILYPQFRRFSGRIIVIETNHIRSPAPAIRGRMFKLPSRILIFLGEISRSHL